MKCTSTCFLPDWGSCYRRQAFQLFFSFYILPVFLCCQFLTFCSLFWTLPLCLLPFGVFVCLLLTSACLLTLPGAIPFLPACICISLNKCELFEPLLCAFEFCRGFLDYISFITFSKYISQYLKPNQGLLYHIFLMRNIALTSYAQQYILCMFGSGTMSSSK